MRARFLSDALSSTYPSPDTIERVDTAPAFQPVAAVFVRSLPAAVAPTTAVHATGSVVTPPGVGVGVGVGATSSFVIVPVPCARDNVAPTGLLSVTVNVSFDSTTVSPLTATEIVFDVWPGANVRLPLCAV